MAQVTRDFDKLNEPPHIPPPSPTLLSKPLLLDCPAPPPLPRISHDEMLHTSPKRSRGEDHMALSIFPSLFFRLFILLCFHIWWEGINQSWKGIIPPFSALAFRFVPPPLFQLLFKSLWCQGGAAAASIPSLHFSFLFFFFLSPISLVPSWKLMKWASPSPFLSSLGLGDDCQIAYTAGINCERSVVV